MPPPESTFLRSSVGKGAVESCGVFLLDLFHFAGFENFAAVEAFHILRVVVLGDQLSTRVRAGRFGHGGIQINVRCEYSTGFSGGVGIRVELTSDLAQKALTSHRDLRGSPAGMRWLTKTGVATIRVVAASGRRGELTTPSSMQKQLGTAVLYGIALLLVYLAYLVFSPFLVPLAWAAVLVVVSYPLYEWVAREWGPTRAAILCTVAVTLILIVPVLF